jgi:hypothetical protein
MKIRKINTSGQHLMNISTKTLGMFGKARRNKFGLGTAAIVAAAGVMFTGASYLFLADDIKSREWPSAPAVVTNVSRSTNSDGDQMYRPTVEYKVSGVTYQNTSPSSSSSAVSIGDERTIRYNPNSPSEGVIAMSGTDWFIILFPIVGIGLILGSIVGLIKSVRRGKAIKSLKQSGMKLQGIVTNVEQSSQHGSVTITVTAQEHTGQVRMFQSDSMSGNTFTLLQYQQQPIAMDVYVDPSDPANYYVDLDDVPELDAAQLGNLLKLATNRQPVGMAPTSTIPAAPPVSPAIPPVPPIAPAPIVSQANLAGTDNTDVPPARNYQ